jgi:hypothetical protein
VGGQGGLKGSRPVAAAGGREVCAWPAALWQRSLGGEASQSTPPAAALASARSDEARGDAHAGRLASAQGCAPRRCCYRAHPWLLAPRKELVMCRHSRPCCWFVPRRASAPQVQQRIVHAGRARGRGQLTRPGLIAGAVPAPRPLPAGGKQPQRPRLGQSDRPLALGRRSPPVPGALATRRRCRADQAAASMRPQGSAPG